MKATLGELELASAPSNGRHGAGEDSGAFGLAVEPLTKERARQLDVATDAGVLITGVAQGSTAADAGFRTGDVIEQVDGKSVASVDQLRAALKGASDRPALVLIHRGDQTLFLTLERG